MKIKFLWPLVLGLSIVIVDNKQYLRSETVTLSESQRQQLRSLGAKIILPSYIPQGFRLSEVKILGEDRKGYVILFENAENSCFLVEGVEDASGDDGLELEGTIAIDSNLFGQGYWLNYGTPKNPELKQQFPESDLYSDWMKIGEYFYRLSGALIAREEYDYPNCRQDLSPSEAVKVIESFGDSN
jgi:hypothetical protein